MRMLTIGGNGFLFIYYLYLPQLSLNSEYRECEHRTYIVKEHCDRLNPAHSQKTRHFLSEHSIGMRRIAGGMGGGGGLITMPVL